MSRLVAGLVGAVCCLVPLPPLARASACADTPFVFNEQPHPVVRPVGTGFALLSDARPQHVELRDARTGALRWSSGPVDEGATYLADADDQVTTVTLLPCASVLVRRWSAATGRLAWSRTLPGLPNVTASHAMFLVAEHDLGQGDWNHDSVPDLALLQVARGIQAPFDQGLCQPSGYCASATQPTTDTRLAVLDGKTGRALLTTSLGRPSIAESAATWAADRQSILAAYDAGSGAGTVVERLSARARTSATLPLPVATDLQVFGTRTPVLVSTVSANQDEAMVYTGLTPALGVAWVREVSGGRETFPLSASTLLASGGANSVAVSLDTATGVPAWAAPTPSTFGNTYNAGRWSSATTDDVAVVEPNATGDGTTVSEILSGTTGLPVTMLDADEWPEQTCDPAAGLATVVHPYVGSPTLRLRRASGAVAWSLPFAVPKHDRPVVVCGNRRAGIALAYVAGLRAQVAVDLATGRALWRAQLPVAVDP